MRLRLFLFLLVFIFTMIAGVVLILLVTGVFQAGINESKQIIHNELNHFSDNISKQYGMLSIKAVEFSKELSKKIEEDLGNHKLIPRDLKDHPELLEEVLSNAFEPSFYSLMKANCSGVFLILDATVNPNLENSDVSKAGLYIKNMEPNIISSTTPYITMLRGFSSIGRKNSIDLHTQWNMEFDISDAPYYKIPMETAKKSPEIPVSRMYYWCPPLKLPNTSEEVMICSVPLIDSNNYVYGVCGFEVSSMLFKLTHMPLNTHYSRLFCTLSPIKEDKMNITSSMLAGRYSVKQLSDQEHYLTMGEYKRGFSTYHSDENYYLGYHETVRLYPKGSPFYHNEWISAILVPEKDIISSITRLNWIMISLLCFLISLGIIISVFFSNKYLKPLSEGIEIIKTSDPTNAPKTNVQEIDELIQYLIRYKSELNKRLEKDKYQISLLEQFIENTKLLSPAERSVFHHYIRGLTAREIAEAMFLSINTIKTHSKHIFAKLNVNSREELLLYIQMLKEIGKELK